MSLSFRLYSEIAAVNISTVCTYVKLWLNGITKDKNIVCNTALTFQ